MPEAINPLDRWPPPQGRGRRPLWSRLLGRPWPPLDVLVLKTKTCPLCVEATGTLERFRGSHGLDIRGVFIDEDPEALTQFGDRVPVVLIAGRERFFGHVDPALLHRTIEGERRR